MEPNDYRDTNKDEPDNTYTIDSASKFYTYMR